ncbi:uncharacterized protein LOC125677971 isoform X1 [Ostrea edulis]|uniref:uncharacterized protein LOC125677971 isoform X1 n=1 Tax=Ostrea edulis TaxID=37623 RepID=UPI0024AFA96F|nr:uncharacterized protein LOC125677971 isoform X1 [Ostrea edulis]
MKQGLSEKSFLIVIMGVSIGIIVTGIVGIVVLKRLTMFRCGETVFKEHKDKRLPSRNELTATALSSTTITDHRENPTVKVSNEPRLTSTKSRTLGPSTYSTLQNPSSSQDLKNTNKQKRPMLILEESCTHRMNGKASTLPISGLKETRVPFNIQDRRPREDYLEEMQSEILKPEGGILTFETDVESKKYNRSKYTIDNEIRVNCELHDFVSTKNETPKTSDDLNSNRYSLVKRM